MHFFIGLASRCSSLLRSLAGRRRGLLRRLIYGCASVRGVFAFGTAVVHRCVASGGPGREIGTGSRDVVEGMFDNLLSEGRLVVGGVSSPVERTDRCVLSPSLVREIEGGRLEGLSTV